MLTTAEGVETIEQFNQIEASRGDLLKRVHGKPQAFNPQAHPSRPTSSRGRSQQRPNGGYDLGALSQRQGRRHRRDPETYGGLSPSPGQRVEREYRPTNAAKRQGAEVADICPRREDGVTPRCDRTIGAPVSDAGLQADDRKRRGIDTLAA
jgi:hypothetical protein